MPGPARDVMLLLGEVVLQLSPDGLIALALLLPACADTRGDFARSGVRMAFVDGSWDIGIGGTARPKCRGRGSVPAATRCTSHGSRHRGQRLKILAGVEDRLAGCLIAGDVSEGVHPIAKKDLTILEKFDCERRCQPRNRACQKQWRKQQRNSDKIGRAHV